MRGLERDRPAFLLVVREHAVEAAKTPRVILFLITIARLFVASTAGFGR